ncbi:MAG: N-acetyltransferase [Deltaproteobacteria bacterium]|nr:N-acetyltransferase [Deltaproteobacteria bacterium]
MALEIKTDCRGVDWLVVSETLKLVGMAYHAPELHQKAFEASHITVFVYDGARLIGFGRAISDGAYQGAVYDVAILPEFQRKGIGTAIMKEILEGLSFCNILLYASPGKEEFYTALGFRKMLTGMALFTNADLMQEKGFTL